MSKNIFVRVNGILEKIDPKDIHFINADGNYCIINTLSNKKYAVKISLTALAEKLKDGFAQVHRGYVVQILLIDSIDTVGQSMMVAGKQIPFGRKFREALLHEHLIVI